MANILFKRKIYERLLSWKKERDGEKKYRVNTGPRLSADDVMYSGRLRHGERKIKDVRMDFIDRKYRY